ncbi:hypothetical protein, partial [Paraburkholderia sp. UYCP14C]|uniref:hypothetical protein n=1 Tax=Paraburkholderia sp. UYCP14C TaxID=2511130 RepID=UPI001B7D68CF
AIARKKDNMHSRTNMDTACVPVWKRSHSQRQTEQAPTIIQRQPQRRSDNHDRITDNHPGRPAKMVVGKPAVLLDAVHS